MATYNRCFLESQLSRDQCVVHLASFGHVLAPSLARLNASMACLAMFGDNFITQGETTQTVCLLGISAKQRETKRE